MNRPHRLGWADVTTTQDFERRFRNAKALGDEGMLEALAQEAEARERIVRAAPEHIQREKRLRDAAFNDNSPYLINRREVIVMYLVALLIGAGLVAL